MATTPREKYDRRRETFEQRAEAGEVPAESAEAIRELLDAYDEEKVTVPRPERASYREPATLAQWIHRLEKLARHRDLATATADGLNGDIEALRAGSHPLSENGGIKKSTLRTYQSALRRFYTYHEFGVEPGDIPMYSPGESGLTPEDTLTREETDTARKAAGNPRDRLIFDLLLYTGQRREAVRTLRVKDVEPNDGATGVYRINSEVDGLKDFRQPRSPRPLLGAQDAVRDWINKYHPDPRPENYLITARPRYSKVDPTEPVTGETIRAVMARIKEASGISKPMHPHSMRHNFVTLCRLRYDMDPEDIKYLLGHSKESVIFETTYSHLSGGDHLKRAEAAFGIEHDEDESELTPETCDICGHPLGAGARECEGCGKGYTPDGDPVRTSAENPLTQMLNRALNENDDAALGKLTEAVAGNLDPETWAAIAEQNAEVDDPD